MIKWQGHLEVRDQTRMRSLLSTNYTQTSCPIVTLKRFRTDLLRFTAHSDVSHVWISLLIRLRVIQSQYKLRHLIHSLLSKSDIWSLSIFLRFMTTRESRTHSRIELQRSTRVHLFFDALHFSSNRYHLDKGRPLCSENLLRSLYDYWSSRARQIIAITVPAQNYLT